MDDKQAKRNQDLVNFVRTAKADPLTQKAKALLGRLGQDAQTEQAAQKAQLEGFLATAAGHDFLANKPEGQALLATQAGRDFLATPAGTRFLAKPAGQTFLGTHAGTDFLVTPAGKAFLATNPGNKFSATQPGKDFQTFAASRAGQAAIQAEQARQTAVLSAQAVQAALPPLDLPQDLVVFMGILGDSPIKGPDYQRLYLTMQLNEYIEFPVDKLVCLLDSFGTVMETVIIWLQRDATVEYHVMQTIDLHRGFLQGNVAGAFGSQREGPMAGYGGGGSAFCGGTGWCGAGGAGGGGSAFCGGGGTLSNQPCGRAGGGSAFCGGGGTLSNQPCG